MTAFDIIYIIGAGVAFIMSFLYLVSINKNLPKGQQSLIGVIIISCILAYFSWAVPIWWLGNTIYNRKFKK